MATKMIKTKVVLIHGWGLNSGIWKSYIANAQRRQSKFDFHLIDLPGYGNEHHLLANDDIQDVALHCLDRAPENAIWVGWSLGGLAALKAYELDKGKQIRALQLISTLPKFVSSETWRQGVGGDVFQRFSDELKNDYQKALAMFLQLQLLNLRNGRRLIKEAVDWIAEYPDPSPLTLQAGIECLKLTDLRDTAIKLGINPLIPIQIVCGSLDRVANPEGVAWLANNLSAELVTLHTGHAAFLAEPDAVFDHLCDLLARTDG